MAARSLRTFRQRALRGLRAFQGQSPCRYCSDQYSNSPEENARLTHGYPSRLHSLQSIVSPAALFVMLRLAVRDKIVATTTARGPLSRSLTDARLFPTCTIPIALTTKTTLGTVSKTWRPAVEAQRQTTMPTLIEATTRVRIRWRSPSTATSHHRNANLCRETQ